MLTMASPVLALSLGVSPAQVELDVPGNGSLTTNVMVHYFTGDVQISLIDIPLRVEPSTIHVDATDNPVPVELTIYGDNSLGSQEYNGYIRFVAVSGGASTGGVQVIAKVTNLVDGVPVSVLAVPAAQAAPVAPTVIPEAVPEVTVEVTDVKVVPKKPSVTATNPTPAPSQPPVAEAQPSTFPLIPVIIGVGGGILLTVLVITGIGISRRR